MNAFTKQHSQLGKLKPEMQDIASRIKGCAGLIDALADCEHLDLGLKEADAHAAKSISRRLTEYADIWQAAAMHIASPWQIIERTSMRAETIRYASAWMDQGDTSPHELGELFECYADYLDPCFQAFRAIEHRYSDAASGSGEARTFNAMFFICDEFQRLITDMMPLVSEVQSAWVSLSRPHLVEMSA